MNYIILIIILHKISNKMYLHVYKSIIFFKKIIDIQINNIIKKINRI
jgi:hypothetical protein